MKRLMILVALSLAPGLSHGADSMLGKTFEGSFKTRIFEISLSFKVSSATTIDWTIKNSWVINVNGDKIHFPKVTGTSPFDYKQPTVSFSPSSALNWGTLKVLPSIDNPATIYLTRMVFVFNFTRDSINDTKQLIGTLTPTFTMFYKALPLLNGGTSNVVMNIIMKKTAGKTTAALPAAEITRQPFAGAPYFLSRVWEFPGNLCLRPGRLRKAFAS